MTRVSTGGIQQFKRNRSWVHYTSDFAPLTVGNLTEPGLATNVVRYLKCPLPHMRHINISEGGEKKAR